MRYCIYGNDDKHTKEEDEMHNIKIWEFSVAGEVISESWTRDQEKARENFEAVYPQHKEVYEMRETYHPIGSY